MEYKTAGGLITRHGMADTVWVNDVICLWILNHGGSEERFSLGANLALSDKELLKAFTDYVRWRRLNPPSADPAIT
jgi:hypothetical protein